MDQSYWIANIKGKIKETEILCYKLLIGAGGSTPPNNRGASRNLLEKKINELEAMFAVGHAPKAIRDLNSAAQGFYMNPDDRGAFEYFNSTIKALPNIVGDATSIISFHDIFESFKSSDALDDLFEQLISSLEKIVEEGDEALNAKAQRDLQKLLDQLKAKRKSSSYEIAAWAEIAAKVVFEIIGHNVGFPALSSLVDVVKTARKIRDTSFKSFQSAQNECVHLLDLKSVKTNYDDLPDINTTIQMLETNTDHSTSTKSN